MATKINYPIGGYAPGNYIRACNKCAEYFEGDKGAIHCEACAINGISELLDELLNKNRKYKELVTQLQSVKETLNTLV